MAKPIALNAERRSFDLGEVMGFASLYPSYASPSAQPRDRLRERVTQHPDVARIADEIEALAISACPISTFGTKRPSALPMPGVANSTAFVPAMLLRLWSGMGSSRAFTRVYRRESRQGAIASAYCAAHVGPPSRPPERLRDLPLDIGAAQPDILQIIIAQLGQGPALPHALLPQVQRRQQVREALHH